MPTDEKFVLLVVLAVVAEAEDDDDVEVIFVDDCFLNIFDDVVVFIYILYIYFIIKEYNSTIYFCHCSVFVYFEKRSSSSISIINKIINLLCF